MVAAVGAVSTGAVAEVVSTAAAVVVSTEEGPTAEVITAARSADTAVAVTVEAGMASKEAAARTAECAVVLPRCAVPPDTGLGDRKVVASATPLLDSMVLSAATTSEA